MLYAIALNEFVSFLQAPSFIVPYIYEKTPLTDKNFNDVSGKNKPASLQSPEVTKIISSNFAGSTLFNLTAGLGEDLVQEFVHRDMIYKEQRRPKSDRNEANITALKDNLNLIQKNTEDFHLKLKVCTGKSLSEALIFASINPQYDKRLFINLPVLA